MLALNALLDLELEQLDVKTTFLHSVLDEEINMDQPKGFVQGHNYCETNSKNRRKEISMP